MKFLKNAFEKIFGINDSPQKIAVGMAIGVFFGVLPLIGPVPAAALAALLKVNKVAAVTGSLLTNVWVTIPSFFAAVAIGEFITGESYAKIIADWTTLLKGFTWKSIFDFSIYDVFLPVILGYIIVSLLLALLAYVVTYVALRFVKRNRMARF